MTQLGTLEELPASYLDKLARLNLVPLWPYLRSFLPYGIPERKTQAAHWSYQAIRPLLLEAGDLTPIEKAERRVLVLCNPGHNPEAALITPSIYVGLQLINPGETAPNHQHSPSAIRLVVEGSGGFTTVRGEKLPMEPGDLILTPPGLWHEHGHEGDDPVIWMDALDLPLICGLEASYCIDGEPQGAGNEPDSSQTSYRRSGLLPYESLDSRADQYPLLRFPWSEAKTALNDLSRARKPGELVHLAYVNPETGRECMPVLGFSALMLRPGEQVKIPKRSASSVLKVVEGNGQAEIDGIGFNWEQHDILAVPTHSSVTLSNGSTQKAAYIFLVDDAPLQRRIGIYEVFN